MFAGSDRVDTIWANLASSFIHFHLRRAANMTLSESLISGPLSSTEAFCVKVSTSPKEETPNYQHVICLYMPNVYDKDSVTKVRIHTFLYPLAGLMSSTGHESLVA